MEDGSGWIKPRPGRFILWEVIRYPLYRRLGGPQAGLDRCEKSLKNRDSITGKSSP
jgi:hypothetical protein